MYDGVVLERIKSLPPGGKMADLPSHLQHKSFERVGCKKTGGPNLRILRLETEKPSLTVTGYIFNKFVHPVEDRYITPREAACLQDFPRNFEFCGTLGQVQTAIGNAVPVNLGAALGKQVVRYFRDLRRTGMIDVASYFTGAGGLDLGLELASERSVDVQMRTRYCSDIEPSAVATLLRNRPEWNPELADIRSLSPDHVRSFLREKNLILVGGPPCQPFSVAGKQLGTSDPLGVLYRDYLKHVECLSPELVIMENVYGMAQGNSGAVVAEIRRSFEGMGFGVHFIELLAARFGTPQLRRRVIFAAARHPELWRWPEPTHSETADLCGLKRFTGAGESFAGLPAPKII